jgi:hypothetical protein
MQDAKNNPMLKTNPKPLANEIQWAPRVSPNKIRQLYEDDAKHIINHELLQDVGISFYARAESIIAVNRIHLQGMASCGNCGKDVPVSQNQYACECGWNMNAKKLLKTYQHKQLVGPSITGFAEKFIHDWKIARDDPNRQMRAIDFLIHRFHWEMTENPTRPVAINYIEGKINEIMRLILELAYKDDPSRKTNLDDWLKSLDTKQKFSEAKGREPSPVTQAFLKLTTPQ